MTGPDQTAVPVRFDRNICGYCGSCMAACPETALVLADAHLIHDPSLCDGCLSCIYACPAGAVSRAEKNGAAPEESESATGDYFRS